MKPSSRSRAAVSVAVAWPAPPRRAIVPVFLPFFGCPRRCLFCSQEAQTGRRAPGPADLAPLLAEARQCLELRAARGLPPAELAFYGGTFTALPPEALDACLAFAAAMQAAGLASSFRCSTRPDRVDAAILRRLAGAGCATVELGVQSFSGRALALTGRGYTGREAKWACAQVRDSGLALVVQLLPGMPGVTPEVFRADVRAALEAGATALRFYPCLVLEGTGLAARWRAGEYMPWDLELTLDTLAEGWRMARKAGALVLRMGVASGEDLGRALLSGPWHPALGGRVLGRALWLEVRELLRTLRRHEGAGALHLDVPAHAQGHFWGHGGELREGWAALGLGPGQVRFAREPVLRLWVEE
ncbi:MULTISPECIES: radical SAM protein [unclassified Desulfovibrio]|uniref:radical SAM protein n=1 Tax=unclassified Desulfovibrio TaxID=2593640 RepID=UPI0013EB623D|nr:MULTISPECIES: radical SAM protein [unclassified Desulfovibrio]